MHIKEAKEKKKRLGIQVNILKKDLYRIIHPAEIVLVLDFCYNNMRRINNKLRTRLEEKLNNLIKNSVWEKEKNENCVLNLSKKHIKNITALSYGLSFSGSYGKPNIMNILENIEKQRLPIEEQNLVKGMIYHCLVEPHEQNIPLRFKKTITDIKKDKTLHITKADKSKSLVILDKTDYINKMNALLNDDKVYKKLNSNPMEKLNSNFNKKLKNTFKFDKQLFNKLFVYTPRLAYLYGLVKTHKENNPMRPVISTINTVSYKLSKWLVNLLSPMLGNISKSHIKNNIHFTEILNSLNLNYNFKMYSLDVKSLYTNVPVNDLLNYLLIELRNHDFILSPEEIIELIALCIKENVFEFDDKIYKQISGLSMGNPLSALLANIYMEFFERDILKKINTHLDLIWYRYVDDIFICWPDHSDINRFVSDLNNLVPTIKFTLERENNNTLPFLDILIHRIDRKFKFEVYRKPTNINSFIHNFSNHEKKIKRSVFISMFLRTLNIVSPEFFDKEIENIYNIGSKHKYNKEFIDECFRIAKKTFYNKTESKQKKEFSKVLVLPYYENFKLLPSLCSKLNIAVIFNYKNKISNILIKNSPTNNQGVVYKINCNSSAQFYIGETGRNINNRISEHEKAVKNKNRNNALFKHWEETGHNFNYSNVKILAKCSSHKKRNLIESFFIEETWNENINIHPGFYKLDKIAKHFIKNLQSD